MRGLYIAFGANFFLDRITEVTSNGIAKKIYNQINSFKRSGIHMDFYNPYSKRNQKIYRIERRLPFSHLHRWDFEYSTISSYDFIYIRKSWYMDGDLIYFLKKVKRVKSSIKIIVEIPTYPYDKELTEIKSLPLVFKDKYWRNHLNLYVDKVVTYSRDKEVFKIPTLTVSNAINFTTLKRKHLTEHANEEEVNLIACSSLAYWHGYDRAIKGLANYYKDGQNSRIVNLHIVGDGEEMEKYKKMIEEYNLNQHVFLYGMLTGSELDKVYEQCEIGLDSLGRHRSGVEYNSSLKGKEYCAKGLLIISGVKTELDYDEQYNYYFKVPADDSDLDFNNIIEFYHDALSKESIQTIQKNIMRYAKTHFDYDVAMKPIINFIK
ncbi:glycosyltransferase [Oceanobacillus saliphilus]|uniref:glycosyltransferase n=1 Tax=Oceanobacillus saliphilus TaxID=2925834 RepID=UPI00201DA6F7|nr:glycosyltransferase [Oceanobacillus saliphilus]